MTAWEYRLVKVTDDLRKIAAAGADGWEAVAMDHGFALMKRPTWDVPEAPKS